MLCLENLLSRDELERARRYRFDADSTRFVTARGMLRMALSRYLHRKPRDIVFEYDLNGKPELKEELSDDMQFNVSHSGSKVVMALARGRRVGVDVERVDNDIPCLNLARHNFLLREVAVLEEIPEEERAKMFCRIWARKEALLKAMGIGLGGLRQSLDLSDGEDVFFQGVQWRILDLDIAQGYAAALAVEGSICEIRMRSADLLLRAD
jgi:4'-phosphopantetheinyl transferase